MCKVTQGCLDKMLLESFKDGNLVGLWATVIGSKLKFHACGKGLNLFV